MEKNSNKSHRNIIDITESPQSVEELNKIIIDYITNLPHLIIDEFNYTIQYCYTAHSFSNDFSRKIGSLNERYTQMPDMLENDLNSAPLIINRLETFLDKLPKDSVTHQFAGKFLPHVKNFYEILKEYKKSKQ